MIGKGHTALLKFCSILGLSSPIVKSQFVTHVKDLEEKAFDLREENLKMAATRARNLVIKENNFDPNIENVDIATSFDGTWCSRGWTASRGVVSAVAEKTSQVIDVAYKCRSCVQCNLIEARKQNGLSAIEYLNQMIDHEPNCFKNHSGSPQVCVFLLFYNKKCNLYYSYPLILKTCLTNNK